MRVLLLYLSDSLVSKGREKSGCTYISLGCRIEKIRNWLHHGCLLYVLQRPMPVGCLYMVELLKGWIVVDLPLSRSIRRTLRSRRSSGVKVGIFSLTSRTMGYVGRLNANDGLWKGSVNEHQISFDCREQEARVQTTVPCRWGTRVTPVGTCLAWAFWQDA